MASQPQGGITTLAIIGGGPAGLSCAIAAAERGLQVTVLEPRQDEELRSRHEMLPEAARTILDRLGVGEVLNANTQLGGVISWWDQDRAVNHAAGPGLGRNRLMGHGWGVDRAQLEIALRARARRLGVELQPLRLSNAARLGGDRWQLTGTGPNGRTSLSCRYAVDASGRPAHLARRLGAHSEFGPALVAITAGVIGPPSPHLLCEATADGWWYYLGNRKAGGTLGFVTSPSNLPGRAATPNYIAECIKTLRLIPNDLRLAAPETFQNWDARSALLSPMSGDGWLATGDAASAFDPVASQGLFNAMSAGFFAGNAAADTLEGNIEGEQIYTQLLARTAKRTQATTPLQYSHCRFKTDFWAARSARPELPTPSPSLRQKSFDTTPA